MSEKKEDIPNLSPGVGPLNYSDMLKRALKRIPAKIKEPVTVEMPQFEVLRESDRTIILNWSKIISKYNIDEKLLLKFLQRRLGTIGMPQHGKLFLQGVYTRARLNKLLEVFMREYVICDVCGRPHAIIIREKGKLIKKCLACGAWRAVERP